MEAVTKLVSILPAPVAAVLMLGGFIFYALGCIRLGVWRSGKDRWCWTSSSGQSRRVQGTKTRRRA